MMERPRLRVPPMMRILMVGSVQAVAMPLILLSRLGFCRAKWKTRFDQFRIPEARASYEKALALVPSEDRQEPERRFLARRLEEVRQKP